MAAKLVLEITIDDSAEHPMLKYRCDSLNLAGRPPCGIGRNIISCIADWLAQHGIEATAILTDNQ